MNDTQWTDDIKSLEDFLCEINGIVAEYDGANYIDTDIYGYKLCNILMDSDNFGVADIVVTDNEAHVMGLYF